jgi:hypothetical protein
MDINGSFQGIQNPFGCKRKNKPKPRNYGIAAIISATVLESECEERSTKMLCGVASCP